MRDDEAVEIEKILDSATNQTNPAYCEMDPDCNCEHCVLVRTINRVRERVRPKHHGRLRNRLMSGILERVFAFEWMKLVAKSYTHNEVVISENLLGKILDDEDFTHRDALVAATVMQWLGTNCGQEYLRACNKRIEARDFPKWDSTTNTWAENGSTGEEG